MYFVEKKKILPFIALVFLATTFHSSAIIFLIVYPLCNFIKPSKKLYAAFIIGLIIGLIIIADSLSYYLKITLPLIFPEGDYEEYVDNNKVASYSLLILITIFFLLSFLIKKPTKTDLNLRVLLILSVLCQSLGLISLQAPRVGFYFFIFIGIALANILKEGNFVYRDKIIGEIALTLFMIFFFYINYSGGYLDVVPYKFMQTKW